MKNFGKYRLGKFLHKLATIPIEKKGFYNMGVAIASLLSKLPTDDAGMKSSLEEDVFQAIKQQVTLPSLFMSDGTITSLEPIVEQWLVSKIANLRELVLSVVVVMLGDMNKRELSDIDDDQLKLQQLCLGAEITQSEYLRENGGELHLQASLSSSISISEANDFYQALECKKTATASRFDETNEHIVSSMVIAFGSANMSAEFPAGPNDVVSDLVAEANGMLAVFVSKLPRDGVIDDLEVASEKDPAIKTHYDAAKAEILKKFSVECPQPVVEEPVVEEKINAGDSDGAVDKNTFLAFASGVIATCACLHFAT